MNITPGELLAEVERADSAWPFLQRVEREAGLPRWLLFAVGSVETNLTNELGDYAPRQIGTQVWPGPWGFGIWQRDKEWSGEFPADWMSNVPEQAGWAAAKLAGLVHQTFPGDLLAAACAYNAGPYAVRRALVNGRSPDSVTTGGDYGTQVLERMKWLEANIMLSDADKQWIAEQLRATSTAVQSGIETAIKNYLPGQLAAAGRTTAAEVAARDTT